MEGHLLDIDNFDVTVGGRVLFTLENIPIDSLKKRKNEIISIILKYIYEFETDEIKIEIKNQCLKLFFNDIRKAKLLQLNNIDNFSNENICKK